MVDAHGHPNGRELAMPIDELWRAGRIDAITRLDRLRDEPNVTVRRAGGVGEPVVVNPDVLQRELRPCLVVAAGFDPTDTRAEPPPVLWDDGASRLVVQLDDAEVRVGPAVIDLSLTVICDQVGHDRVTCTFVTTPLDRPAGFVWATESRPRGPAAVVEVWGEALVALAWRTLVEVAARAAATRGTDAGGRPLVPSTVVATPDGLLVVPMAAHRFMRVDRRIP